MVVPLVLFATACAGVGPGAGDDDAAQTESPSSTIRSSGPLAFADPDEPGPFVSSPLAPAADALAADGSAAEGFGDGPIPSVPVSSTVVADPANPELPQTSGELDNPESPVERTDGIELVFADGTLASIAPRSTIEDIGRTLGPVYIVTEEPFIREGFAGGYSVSQSGEVLFWAVEENGRITTIMATSPRVGLDSGLRPTMPLVDAVALHGEPLLRLGPELREFATFADGTGAAEGVSVLVAIGQFGGPVGVYPGALEPDRETVEYQLTDANIKELWFDLG